MGSSEGPEVFVLCCDLFCYMFIKIHETEKFRVGNNYFFVIAHGSDSQIQHNSLVLHFFAI